MYLKAFSVLLALGCCSGALLDPDLEQLLKVNPKVNILISMKDGVETLLSTLANRVFQSREDRLTTVVSALQKQAGLSQEPVLALLKLRQLTSRNLKYQSFWATNQVYVQGADAGLVGAITTLLPVSSIAPAAFVKIDPLLKVLAPSLMPHLAWGVKRVQAPEAWDLGYRGSGIVVASLDTGVRGTHAALKDKFIGEYGWFDPANGTAEPWDSLGHGTHTTGTMVGAFGIGVAPEAKWMACKACSAENCAYKDLIACGQFLLCPNGLANNCTKAPHIINNSWGGGPAGDTTFNGMISAWRAAGIIPVFSVGNSGPNCNTAGSPGDGSVENAISVGATDIFNSLAQFSSKGPSSSGAIKPEVTAPGDQVFSASSAADNTYIPASGTSMAAPHVSGLIALMLSKNPEMSYEEVKASLFAGCSRDVNKGLYGTQTCGSTTSSVWPNNNFGNGIVNAVSSLNSINL